MKSKRRKYRFGTASGLAVVGLVFAVWAGVVGASAAGWNLFHIEWNYERMGQLGDSFGVVSAVMTSLAAMFTYLTMREERDANKRIRIAEIRNNNRDMNSAAESTFFRLLEARRSIVQNISFQDAYGVGGQAGFDLIINLMPDLSGVVSVRNAFNACYGSNRSGLGHYFRLTYHAVRFVDENFTSNRRRYEMVRLLRAEMSNSELIIVALNCAFGEGRKAFKPLAEKYALFHNIPKEQVQYYKLDNKIDRPAFSSVLAKKNLNLIVYSS